jgi:plasmid stabilization system protein ParE
MRLIWSSKASSDLVRLSEFLMAVNPAAAARVTLMLTHAPERLLQAPRIGQRLASFGPLEVRRLIVDRYEFRYELRGDEIVVLRVWHTREER